MIARRIGLISISMYLLLVSLVSTIPSLLVPSSLMALLAFIAALCLFIDALT